MRHQLREKLHFQDYWRSKANRAELLQCSTSVSQHSSCHSLLGKYVNALVLSFVLDCERTIVSPVRASVPGCLSVLWEVLIGQWLIWLSPRGTLRHLTQVQR